MKKYLFFCLGVLLSLQNSYSQIVLFANENFDGNTISLFPSSTSSWKIDANYYTSSPNSYLGVIPNMVGDSIILSTPPYDFYKDGYSEVYLQFKHICKISPQDILRIEYKIGGSIWQPIPADAYTGMSSKYITSGGFNANSYPEWIPNDSLVRPDNDSWWRAESFDMSYYVGKESSVEFRFILKHGKAEGTQISYGWLLDDFEIIASTYKVKAPIVEFIAPLVKDTVHSAGPWNINAKVKTQTLARIETPRLVYSATNNGGHIKTDSVLMINVSGDSLWQGTIPQFETGTKVHYSIRGKDTTGNYADISDEYYIEKKTESIIEFGKQFYFSAVDTMANNNNNNSVFNVLSPSSWSRTLYLNSELVGDISPTEETFITKIAWYSSSLTNYTKTDISVFLEATTNTTTPTQYIDPRTNTSSLVYKGSMTTKEGWNELTLTKPFSLPAGSNLLVYVEDQSGTQLSGTTFYWKVQNTGTAVNRCVYSTTTTYAYTARNAIMRCTVGDKINFDTNSVALVSIDNPTPAAILAGQLNPIVVTIQNKGDKNLDSATIYWTVNGGNVNQHVWKGNLSWDILSQDTIGYFTPQVDGFDSLVVWVSMPNGKADSVTYDDTLSLVVYGCTQPLEGNYAVGKEGHFPSIDAALYAINNCGVNGNVVLEMITGEYPNRTFSDFGSVMGAYTLTITSKAGHKDSVVFKSASSKPGIVLENVRNLSFEAITVDARNGKHGIQFLNGCTNIVVNNCNILIDSVSTSYSSADVQYGAIYKGDAVYKMDSIRITNNLLEGGYSGIYLNGNSSNYIYNIDISNNIISSQYRYGIVTFYTDDININSNEVLSRSNNIGTTWDAIHVEYNIGNIVGNKIRQRNELISTPMGIVLRYYNNTTISQPMGLVANNEIIIGTTGTTATYRGISTESSNARFLHNSIYVAGNGNGRGIEVADNAVDVEIQNNNIVATAQNAHPVYLSGINYLSRRNINSNNYSAPQYIGYIYGGPNSGNIQNMNDWKQIIGTDILSVNISPAFVDPTENLKLTHYTGLTCDVVSPVYDDIEKNVRAGGITTMGCYEAILSYTGNATLTKIIGLRDGHIVGATDSIKVVVINTGTAPITQLDLAWSFNGVSKTFTKHVSLPSGGIDTLTLDEITYPVAPTTMMVWIERLNDGGLNDEFHGDDTVKTSIFLCPSGLQGRYTVGEGEDFPDLNEALRLLNACGASDNVRLELTSGIYNRNWTISNFGTVMSPYMLTITSKAGHRDSVVFKPGLGTGLTLYDVQNIAIDGITIDARAGTHGVQLVSACTNIVINNCAILVNATNTSSNYPIAKSTESYTLNNLIVTNNLLDGGSSGVYLVGNSTNYTQNVTIDSNIISNQYSYGIHATYTDSLSISNNTILSRNSNTSSNWRGINISYSNGSITNNKVHQESAAITSPYGIYLNYYNAASMSSGLVANNEIILTTTGNYSGIYTSYSNAQILHNSIYMGGIGAARGMEVFNNAVDLKIRNNIIVMESSTAHPVYFAGINNLRSLDINTNNYYAPQYIGYIGGIPTVNISSWSTWRQSLPTDIESISVFPDFVDNTVNLKLFDYKDVLCDIVSPVNNDIEMNPRSGYTTMGCYEGIPSANGNAILTKIIGLEDGHVTGQSDSIKVVLINLGSTPITEVNLGWSFNGTGQAPVIKSVHLQKGERDTIVLNRITYPSTPFITTVWINNLNSGTLTYPLSMNDTISVLTFVCPSGLGGKYTVGNGGDFKNLTQALDVINTCGVSDDIQLQLLSGIYARNWTIYDFGAVMGQYMLTITSKAEHRDSVILKSTGTGITLKNVRNLIFDAITINAIKGTHGIELIDTCTNIIIRNCTILTDSAIANQHNSIYKGVATHKLDGLQIYNNHLSGGHYGIYLYGNNTNYNRNITIDSNLLTNQYYYAIYPVYTECTSISGNTILSRVDNAGSTWRGISMEYSTGVIMNNKIRQRSQIINYPAGIHLNRYHNDGSMGLVANNEIIVSTTTTQYGLYTWYSNAKILHNSIYVGGSGAAKGMVVDNTENYLEIKNNIIAMESADAHPMYLYGKTHMSKWDINSNNYYAPQYIGSVAYANISDWDAWKQNIPTDTMSVKVSPAFIDETVSLKLSDYTDLSCTAFPYIYKDIDNQVRTSGITTMGCYEAIPTYNGNVMLTEITGLREGTVIGQTDSVKVIVINTGETKVTEIKLDWIFDGNTQISVTRQVSIPKGGVDTIALDRITYPSSPFTISIWLNSLNGGILTDQFAGDDTASISLYMCSPLQGGYTVGEGEYFEDLNEAFRVLHLCGVADNVDFRLKSGTYTQNWEFSDFGNVMVNYILTITSKANHRDSVIFKPASGVGVKLQNIHNIGFSAITIDARTGTNAIQLLDGCTNIIINNCNLFTNPTSSFSFQGVIHQGTAGHYVDSIFITNNTIDGGSYGVYFYGNSSNYIKNIIVYNNIISNQHQYAIYPRYVDGLVISSNSILSRELSTAAGATWQGVNLENSNGQIVNNRIRQRNIGVISSPVGIGLSNFNNNTSMMGLIANNEIIIYPTSGQSALSSNNSNVRIIHNSIYVGGTSNPRGILIFNTPNDVEVKNNLITMSSAAAHPIYLVGTDHVSRWDINSNNYYAPQYVGYITNTNIPDLKTWRETVKTDVLSGDMLPDFIDTTIDLKLSDYKSFRCILIPDIDTDIEGTTRLPITAMGAYTSNSLDASDTLNILLNIYNWQREVVNNMDQSVQATVTNKSFVAIQNITFGWTLNGIPQTPYTWNAATAMEIGEETNVTIDFFTVNQDTNKVEIWIDSLNNTYYHNSDTVAGTCYVVPLAEFIAPFVADTITRLSFNVYTKIIEGSGATITAPEMTIETIMPDAVYKDTVSLSYENGAWVASIPKQYYGANVIYTLSLTDTVRNTITLQDSTYLKFISGGEKYADYNLTVLSIEKLVPDNKLCTPDYASVKVTVENTGGHDYDFSTDPVSLEVEVTNPIPFYKDTILTTGSLASGAKMIIEVTDMLPIIIAGQYDVKTWVNSPLDDIMYDDTVLMYYVSGKFGLPIDEDFSNGIPIEFEVKTNNPLHKWDTISQGIGTDTAVRPQFGTKVLAFSGTQGTMSTLSTQQLDLSRTVQPTLSFWYFHDTIPCNDYTDVRITVDGGDSYTTLFELTKYDAVYGWREYSKDLPSFAINQCVVLIFEAMEKSESEDVTQYIDHILITAKQEIVITEVLTSDYSLCDLENKEWKVVLSNQTDPALDYSITPIAITLELVGTSYSFTEIRDSGILHGFTSDTITLASGFDLAPGEYIAKAYISSIWGDIFMDTITIDPNYTIRIHNISSSGSPSQAEIDLRQDVTIKNTGNIPLPQLDLVLTVTADDISPAYYFTTTESTDNILQPGDSITITFNTPYSTPWSAEYRVHALASLHCDPALISKEAAISEYVDIDNLALINIDKPVLGQIDVVGSNINIEVTLENKSDVTSYSNVSIHARIEDSKGNVTANVSGTVTEVIGTSDTKSYTFGSSYPVPEDSVYYIIVFIDKQLKDSYQNDDTIRTKRTTDYKVGIESVDPSKISMKQNIPNPANDYTSITYSIPASGEVIFTISSTNGQVLYNKSIKGELGMQTIDIDVSHLAAGIYFYSMEFNGQRITKRMNIKR